LPASQAIEISIKLAAICLNIGADILVHTGTCTAINQVYRIPDAMRVSILVLCLFPQYASATAAESMYLSGLVELCFHIVSASGKRVGGASKFSSTD
jgi:hypothetical protein